MSGKSNRQNQAPHGATLPDTGDMVFWRNLAYDLGPKTKGTGPNARKTKLDDWQLSELATMLQQTTCIVAAHFPKISEICNKTEGQKESAGLTLSLDRAKSPSEITVRIGYTEAFGDKIDVRVPDPNQTELPLDVGGGDASDPDGAGDAE